MLIKETCQIQISSPKQAIEGTKQEHGLKILPWVRTLGNRGRVSGRNTMIGKEIDQTVKMTVNRKKDRESEFILIFNCITLTKR